MNKIISDNFGICNPVFIIKKGNIRKKTKTGLQLKARFLVNLKNLLNAFDDAGDYIAHGVDDVKNEINDLLKAVCQTVKNAGFFLGSVFKGGVFFNICHGKKSSGFLFERLYFPTYIIHHYETKCNRKLFTF